MNVASLLQDSPSDDRAQRLHRQHAIPIPRSSPSLPSLSHSPHPLPNARRDQERDRQPQNHLPSRPPSRPIHPPPPPAEHSPPPSFSANPAPPPPPQEKLQMQVDPPQFYDEYNPQNNHPRGLPAHPPPNGHLPHHSSSKHKSKSSGQKRPRSRHQHPSQFELDWEVKEINERPPPDKEKLNKLSPIATPSIPTSTSPLLKFKAKPKPYHLGTFVYPLTPFPLTDIRQLSRHQEINFTLYVPRDHLPTVIPRQPCVWGGRPFTDPPVDGKFSHARNVYTDDSLLTLLPLHAGYCTLSEFRRPKGDLKIVFNVLLKDGGRCPVRWIGCLGESAVDADRVQSLTWGNGHDGGGVEVLSIEWVKDGQAHRLTIQNRRARLKEYAERRGHLASISINLSFTSEATDDDPSDLAVEKIDVHEPLPPVQLGSKHPQPIPEDDVKIPVLMFEGNGRLGFKYTPETLQHALYPAAPIPIDNPYVDRPKKRRKLDRTPSENNEKSELELQTLSGDSLFFIRPVVQGESFTSENVKQRRWDLVRRRLPTAQPVTNGDQSIKGPGESRSMDQDGDIIKAKVAPSDIEFSVEGICIWDPQSEGDSLLTATEVTHQEKGRGLIFEVKKWRWSTTTQTQVQKAVAQ